MDAATQAELFDEAEQLAVEALARLPDTSMAARTHVLRRLVGLADQKRDWRALQERAIALRREADSPTARWALAVALSNQGKRREAWEVLAEAPRMVPPDDMHASLLVSLQAEFDPGPASVEAILEIAERFPDSEKLCGLALGLIYTMRATSPLSLPLQSRLSQVTEKFFDRYPQSQILKRISFATVEESLSRIRALLEPGLDQLKELARQVNVGQLPYGAFASIRNRSYALALASRDIGCIVARIPDPAWDAASVIAAKNALNRTIVADTAALTVSVAIAGSWTKLLGAFHRILVTDSAVRDAVWAEKEASGRSTLKIGLDPETREVRAYSLTAEQAEKLHEELGELVRRMHQLTQVASNDLTHFPGIEAGRNLAWLSPIEAAAKHRYSLWSDDACVRGLADQLGIPSFGTYDLAVAMCQEGKLDDAVLGSWKKAMLEGLVVDLPFDEDFIIEIARQNEWLPGPVSVALSRPSIWASQEVAVKLFDAIFTRVHYEASAQLPHWLAVSIFGGGRRTAAGVDELAGLLLALAIDVAKFDQAAVPDLVMAATATSGRLGGGDPLRAAVGRILVTAQEIVGMAGAAQFVVSLFASLAEERRRVVRELVFGQPTA